MVLESNPTWTLDSSFSLHPWVQPDNSLLFSAEGRGVRWCLSVGQVNWGMLLQECRYLLLIPEYLSQLIWILLFCATWALWMHFPGFSFTIWGAASLWKKPFMSFCSAVVLFGRNKMWGMVTSFAELWSSCWLKRSNDSDIHYPSGFQVLLEFR